MVNTKYDYFIIITANLFKCLFFGAKKKNSKFIRKEEEEGEDEDGDEEEEEEVKRKLKIKSYLIFFCCQCRIGFGLVNRCNDELRTTNYLQNNVPKLNKLRFDWTKTHIFFLRKKRRKKTASRTKNSTTIPQSSAFEFISRKKVNWTIISEFVCCCALSNWACIVFYG